MREITDGERTAFLNLVFSEAASPVRDGAGIGTYNEKVLHRLLKCYFEPDRQYHEVMSGRFIADIKRDGCITEIQTVSLARMGEKLTDFLCENQVRIVFPVEMERHIVWIDPKDGTVSQRNRSPKRGSKYTLLAQLIYLLDHIPNDRLTITAVYISVDEYRMLDGRGRDRKKGSTKLERVPIDIFGISDYRSPDDYAQLVPDELPSPFERKDFSLLTGLRGRELWAGLRVLEHLDFICRVPSPDRKHRYAVRSKYNAISYGAADYMCTHACGSKKTI